MSIATTFAGRVSEKQALFRELSLASVGSSRLVAVDAERGAGVSAVLEVFAELAASARPEAVVVRSVSSGSEAYAPVTEAADRASRAHLADRLTSRRDAARAAHDLLPEWLAAIPIVGQTSAALLATHRRLTRRSRRFVPAGLVPGSDAAEVILAIAARRTVVLLLDDLEQAGADALAPLERLVRRWDDRHRLLVVVASGTPASRHERSQAQQLLDLLPPERLVRLPLPPLSENEIEIWLGKRFPHLVIPPGFAARLRASTAGLARDVASEIERLAADGVIRFEGRRWRIDGSRTASDAGHVPIASEADAAALKRLDPPTREIVQGASRLGEAFDGTTLSAMLGRDELTVEDAMARAAREGVVEILGEVTLPDGEIATRYRFRSPGVRAALAEAR
jgi:predicted ATPase